VTQRRWTTTRSPRAGLAAVVLAGGMLVGLAGPALAQVTTVETVPPEVDEDGRTVALRKEHGVHFHEVGADLLARQLEERLVGDGWLVAGG